MNIIPHVAKNARYTIGARIENTFLDLLELSYVAYFTEKEKKMEKVTKCLLVLDTLKFLVSVAWEGKLISNKQCEDVALKLEEVGKMFGGWKKISRIPKRKTTTSEVAEKKAVSETEHELVVRIPLIVRPRPIVVEPQTVAIAFELEDVRVAVGVGSCETPSVPLSI
ncbi:MAG: four helix bundle protein [bacterium]